MKLRDVRNEKDVDLNVGSTLLIDGVLCQLSSIDLRTKQMMVTPLNADHCREYAAKLSEPGAYPAQVRQIEENLRNRELAVSGREANLQDWENRLVETEAGLHRQHDSAAEKLSPSEAVIAFGAWLTTLSEPITVGAEHDASVIAEMTRDFNNAQRFADPRDGWHDKVVPMGPQIAGEGNIGEDIPIAEGPGSEATPSA